MFADAGEVARLNDLFRQTFVGGEVVMTQGVASLSADTRNKVIGAVRTFAAFTDANDPHGEHDFGAFEFDGTPVMFKIDYYDKDLAFHSPDPADPTVTERVITLMLAEEY